MLGNLWEILMFTGMEAFSAVDDSTGIYYTGFKFGAAAYEIHGSGVTVA
jgi:hypothetical protein